MTVVTMIFTSLTRIPEHQIEVVDKHGFKETTLTSVWKNKDILKNFYQT